MFISELNGKCHLHQKAEFTQRKKKRRSMAEEGPKKRQRIASSWNKREAVEPSHHSPMVSFLYSKCSFPKICLFQGHRKIRWLMEDIKSRHLTKRDQKQRRKKAS